jgi:hypothetical protein
MNTSLTSDPATGRPSCKFPSLDMVAGLKSSLTTSGQTPEFADAIVEAARTRVQFMVQTELRKHFAGLLKTRLAEVSAKLGEIGEEVDEEEYIPQITACHSKNFRSVGVARSFEIQDITAAAEEIADLAQRWEDLAGKHLADWMVPPTEEQNLVPTLKKEDAETLPSRQSSPSLSPISSYQPAPSDPLENKKRVEV